MKEDRKRYFRAMKIVAGEEKPDLVIKNAKVVNVFTEKIESADIAIADGFFIGIGSFSGKEEMDVQGRYVCPGYIDSHLHLESTLVTPPTLIAHAALCGTTTFIVDPHESANVAGSEGIDYILNQTSDVKANVFVMMPSCVPATDIDDNGARISAEDMKPYLDNKRILGLGEVMDYRGVLQGSPSLYEKMELFQDKILDGHAPLLTPTELDGYAYSGISTDHESTSYAYAMEERKRGMKVLIREGSAAKNLDAIVSGLVKNQDDLSGFSFCTDDKHIEDIQKDGHINYNVKKAISLGIPPIKAIKMATIHAAETYHLHTLGAIAPGYQADFIIFENLNEQIPEEVYYKGKRITKQQPSNETPNIKSCLLDSVHVGDFKKEKLDLQITSDRTPVISMIPGQIITEKKMYPFTQGSFKPYDDFTKIAVIERHKKTGLVGIGVVEGFGIKGGAIASSVSHDSHNIVVIGDNDEDIYLAAKEVIDIKGGFSIVSGGKVLGILPLAIMGLISDEPYEITNKKLKRMIKIAHDLGVKDGIEPFIALSFMALPVLPSIRITPRGVIDVN